MDIINKIGRLLDGEIIEVSKKEAFELLERQNSFGINTLSFQQSTDGSYCAVIDNYIARENDKLKQELLIERQRISDETTTMTKIRRHLMNEKIEFIDYLKSIISNLDAEQSRRFNHSTQTRIDVYKNILNRFQNMEKRDSDNHE